MEYRSTLSDTSIANLRLILGHTVHSLSSPNLDAAGPELASWALSIWMEKGRYITFECEWRETPVFMLDFWTIHVAENSHPLRIKTDESGALISPCSISIYNATPVEAIDVYRFSDSHEDKGISEAVEYDGALVFRCQNEKQFAIFCSLHGPGLAEYLRFTESPEVIARVLATEVLRLTLQ